MAFTSGAHKRSKSGQQDQSLGATLMLLLLIVVSSGATYSLITALFGGSSPSLNQGSTAESLAKTTGISTQPDTASLDAGSSSSETMAMDTSAESAAAAAGDPGCMCRGVQGMELWGETVEWGEDNKPDTAEECCKQCRKLCEEGSDCQCNSWVYCENEQLCGASYKQCWLKKQPDVMKPDIHGEGANVGWTSGILHQDSMGWIVLEAGDSKIRIKLRPDWAPLTVKYIREVINLRVCTGCMFYRAEGLGMGWTQDGKRTQDPPGPPYALVQGTLQTDGLKYVTIPKEASPSVKRGHACLIQGGPDFFISLADHPEWGNSHTVFGEVVAEDMAVVESFTTKQTTEEKWGEVQVQALAEAVTFRVVPYTGH